MNPSVQRSAPQLTSFGDEHEARLLEQVRALRPLLEASAMEAERQRTMAAPVFRALDEIGIWYMLLPRRWGGYGMSVSAMGRVNREIAKGDPSVAWVVQIINGSSWIASLASDELQEELFAKGPAKICSSFAVPGRAVPVEGGYVVSGEWPYNSGSRQSDWSSFLVNIHHADGRVAPGNFAFVKMKDVEIVDTWFVAGMQGTSSDSSRVAELFVPEHCMVLAERPYGWNAEARRHTGEPGDHLLNMPTIRAAGLNLQLGAVSAAAELLVETAKVKGIATTTYKTMDQSPVVQRNIGEILTRLHAATLVVDSLCQTLDAHALAQQKPTLALRALNKGMCSHVADSLNQIMALVMNTAGTSAYLLNSKFQRYWRDVSVATHHAIYNQDVGYEVFGRFSLGVEPNIMPPPLI